MTAPTLCPNCSAEMRHIPAGVSKKTGKPYGEFWACSDRKCGYIWRPDKKTEIKVNDDKVMEALRVINENVKSLHTKFDSFTSFFTQK